MSPETGLIVTTRDDGESPARIQPSLPATVLFLPAGFIVSIPLRGCDGRRELYEIPD